MEVFDETNIFNKRLKRNYGLESDSSVFPCLEILEYNLHIGDWALGTNQHIINKLRNLGHVTLSAPRSLPIKCEFGTSDVCESGQFCHSYHTLPEIVCPVPIRLMNVQVTELYRLFLYQPTMSLFSPFCPQALTLYCRKYMTERWIECIINDPIIGISNWFDLHWYKIGIFFTYWVNKKPPLLSHCCCISIWIQALQVNFYWPQVEI